MTGAAHARRLEASLGAYTRLLQRHWRAAGEEVLDEAYQLGRNLLASGATLLDISELHHRSLAAASSSDPPTPGRLLSAGRLLNEVEAGYEMLLRGYHDANAALRHANEHLEEQIEQIARALHDESGQLLAAVMIGLDESIARLPPPQRDDWTSVRNLLDQVEFGIRRLAHELHPALLNDLGLRPALEFLADGVAGRSGLRIAVEGELPQRLPHALELCFYRCVQESLNNVVRHAHASQARIQLRQSGATVEVHILDNGHGFASAHPKQSGMGLAGMRERLRGVGGELEVHSRPGAGVAVCLRVPASFPGDFHGDPPAVG
ncbi:MAG: ATP-binding protein [Terriglobales bacterium]